MDSIQNAAVEETPPPPPKARKHKKKKTPPTKPSPTSSHLKSDNYEDNYGKYSREANEDMHNRHKRATRRDENKKTCSLYIQTDPLIWRHIREGFPEVILVKIMLE